MSVVDYSSLGEKFVKSLLQFAACETAISEQLRESGQKDIQKQEILTGEIQAVMLNSVESTESINPSEGDIMMLSMAQKKSVSRKSKDVLKLTKNASSAIQKLLRSSVSVKGSETVLTSESPTKRKKPTIKTTEEQLQILNLQRTKSILKDVEIESPLKEKAIGFRERNASQITSMQRYNSLKSVANNEESEKKEENGEEPFQEFRNHLMRNQRVLAGSILLQKGYKWHAFFNEQDLEELNRLQQSGSSNNIHAEVDENSSDSSDPEDDYSTDPSSHLNKFKFQNNRDNNRNHENNTHNGSGLLNKGIGDGADTLHGQLHKQGVDNDELMGLLSGKDRLGKNDRSRDGDEGCGDSGTRNGEVSDSNRKNGSGENSLSDWKKSLRRNQGGSSVRVSSLLFQGKIDTIRFKNPFLPTSQEIFEAYSLKSAKNIKSIQLKQEREQMLQLLQTSPSFASSSFVFQQSEMLSSAESSPTSQFSSNFVTLQQGSVMETRSVIDCASDRQNMILPIRFKRRPKSSFLNSRKVVQDSSGKGGGTSTIRNFNTEQSTCNSPIFSRSEVLQRFDKQSQDVLRSATARSFNNNNTNSPLIDSDRFTRFITEVNNDSQCETGGDYVKEEYSNGKDGMSSSVNSIYGGFFALKDGGTSSAVKHTISLGSTWKIGKEIVGNSKQPRGEINQKRFITYRPLSAAATAGAAGGTSKSPERFKTEGSVFEESSQSSNVQSGQPASFRINKGNVNACYLKYLEKKKHQLICSKLEEEEKKKKKIISDEKRVKSSVKDKKLTQFDSAEQVFIRNLK